MRNKISLKLLVIMLLGLAYLPVAVYASEITGNLSSSGISTTGQNTSGNISGTVISGNQTSNTTSGGGGGSIVIDNSYFNNQLNTQSTSPNTLSRGGQVLGASTYSPPKIYRTPTYNNIAYANNVDRVLAVGGGEFPDENTTVELAQDSNPTVVPTISSEVVQESGMWGMSYGAWILLLLLLLIAIIAYYYLRNKN